MALQIVTADERLAEANSKTTVAIFGPPGVGKTSLLWSLLASTTLVRRPRGRHEVASQDWPGDSIPIRSWLDAVDIACLIGGVDPSADPSAFFSEGHYQHVADGLSRPGPADRVEADHLRRQHHRADPAVHGLGQDQARGLQREDRQTRCPRRLRPAWPRGDRAAQAPAACARQVGDLRGHPRAGGRRVQPRAVAAADGGRQGRARAARHRRPGDQHEPVRARWRWLAARAGQGPGAPPGVPLRQSLRPAGEGPIGSASTSPSRPTSARCSPRSTSGRPVA